MTFSPPAAAANATSANPPPPPGTGSGPASQEGTVPYWPDITVLRSDSGRSSSSSAELSTALSNIAPGMADAISPAARVTLVPPASSLSLDHPTAGDVREFITRYLHAGQTNDADAEMAFYGERVKYFNEGTVDRRFIAQDVRRYEKRWPQRSFTVVGPISVVADANNLDHTLVHFATSSRTRTTASPSTAKRTTFSPLRATGRNRCASSR